MRTPTNSRRRLSAPIAVLLALLATLVLAGACSSDSGEDAGTDDESTDETTPAASADFEPVTFEHRFGTTEITEAPQRIVSLDPQWTDVLLAMDVTPVGYITHGLQGGEAFPWQGDLLADSEEVLYSNAIPYDFVAALNPDVIVVTYAAGDQAVYDMLSKIAPTIASPSDAEVETWTTITTAAGELLGRPDDAQQVIDDVNGQVDGFAEELGGLDGTTIAFANYVPGANIVVIADPEDGPNALFSQLGLGLAPGIAAEVGDTTGRVQISFEQISLLDGDVLAILTNGAETDDIVAWDTLPAVESGAVVLLDMSEATALNVPTPLSIPFGLEALRPALEVAAQS